ncbi:MAG: C2 family cysteine protease [Candidatus Obscuribacterales bacterium]|nr:C2 family cysteine protease [Candidatus Obscuribacterales bacterium]
MDSDEGQVLAFENTDFAPEKSAQNNRKSAMTEGFTPLQVEAMPGRTLLPSESIPDSPIIYDDSHTRKSVDGGEVTFNNLGSIVAWESKDKSISRKYAYHDSNEDRASLYGVEGEKVFQDQNGTFFQYADIKGQKTPTAKLVTRDFGSSLYTDLRGAAQSGKGFERAVNTDGSPLIAPITLNQNLSLSATLDMVTDNQGHVWRRDEPGQPLTEYIQTSDEKLVKTGKSATDAELLPVDLNFGADKQKLYQDENNPLASIRAASVIQTELPDCYFESSVAENVVTNPQRIVDMIKDNHDGTYTVKFPLSDPTFASKVDFKDRPTLDVTVEAPTALELSIYNRPFIQAQNSGYWASVMEKAHRYLTGKIAEDNGGSSSDGLQLISGVRKFTYFQHPFSESPSDDYTFLKQTFSNDPRDTKARTADPQWLDSLESALAKGEPVLAYTPPFVNQWAIVTGGTEHKEVLGRFTEPGLEQNKFQLLSHHAYSVIGVDHHNGEGQELITIRNPIGHAIFPTTGTAIRPFDAKNNGYFQVRPADFESLFNGFVVNDTSLQ